MQNKHKISKQQKQIIFFIILALLLTSAGIYAGKNWDALFGSQNSPDSSLQLDPNAGKLDNHFTSTPYRQGMIESIQIPGYDTIRLTDGDTLNITLENPAGNPCYFRFTILTEEGEQLYQSGLVPPGEGIPRPKLYRPLTVPSQNASIQIETFSLATKEAMNGATVKTVLST